MAEGGRLARFECEYLERPFPRGRARGENRARRRHCDRLRAARTRRRHRTDCGRSRPPARTGPPARADPLSASSAPRRLPLRSDIGAGAEYGRAVTGLERSRTNGLAVTKNCLVWAQTDHHELGRLIPLLAVGLFLITIHFSPHLAQIRFVSAPARFMPPSMISATTAASSHTGIVENRQNLLRPNPAFDVDFLASDALRRFQ